MFPSYFFSHPGWPLFPAQIAALSFPESLAIVEGYEQQQQLHLTSTSFLEILFACPDQIFPFF